MDGLLPRQPDVTAYTTVNSRGLVLELTAPLINEPLSVQLKPADIVRNQCAKLGGVLAEATRRIRDQRDRVDPAEAGRLIGEIASAGRIFLGYVLREPRDDFHKLSHFLQRACPAWRIRNAQVPLVHVIADADHYFPWELLPLFAPLATAEARDQLELEQASLAFPGFATVLERHDPDHAVNTTFLDGWDRLSVRLVYDASLPGARTEVGFFRGKGHLFRLKGPYPRDITDDKAPTLAQQLCDPALGIDGARTGFPDQIVHFACHCEADGHDTATFTYRLADEQKQEMVIRLDELVDELIRHPPEEKPHDKPLVFLNACGTAVMDPASAASLLKPFHDNHNRGIIGTAANVPDRIAADVSRWFYTNLIAEAMTVGEALHEAKWRLLQDRGNPLGLLYSIHALASLRVAPIPTYA
jgi:hypothetical protein